MSSLTRKLHHQPRSKRSSCCLVNSLVYWKLSSILYKKLESHFNASSCTHECPWVIHKWWVNLKIFELLTHVTHWSTTFQIILIQWDTFKLSTTFCLSLFHSRFCCISIASLLCNTLIAKRLRHFSNVFCEFIWKKVSKRRWPENVYMECCEIVLGKVSQKLN